MNRPSFVITHRGDEGGSAFYRVMTPVLLARHLGMIQTRIPDKMLFFPKELLDIIKPDTVFFHRSHTAPQIRYMTDLARNLDALKVYTIDDWVGKVPKESPHYKDIPHNVDKDIKKAIDLCDKLIVTTDLLASVYGYKKDTYVIPNYLCCTMWEPIYMNQPPIDSRITIPRIGWSGGMGHPGDLKILREIADILGDRVRWVFLGDMPAGFDQGNSEVHNPTIPEQYSLALYNLRLDLALAPLLDNEFNRAKSNLRILEYSACGYPIIASNVKTYQNTPATLLEYNAKWWAEAILQKLADREALRAEGQNMKEWVWKNYKLEDHIKTYANIFSPDGNSFVPTKPDVADTVDVLITTHNKLDIARRCVESVIRSLPYNKSKIEIIVSDDASTETGFPEFLQELTDMGIYVHRNIKNQGYIRSINSCCEAHPDRDVITLNSDTVVNGNWIDRLKHTAYMEANTASVTPFTNNGTIMSYPNPQGTTLEPRLVRFYDEIASEMEPSNYLLLPTSVGFCTYIKRKALADIGLFDDKAFDRGYGEENDWCMRAHDRAWKHLADQTVYVGHEHGASFGQEKQKLLEQSANVLASRWQNYPQLIKQWVETDLLKTTRERFDIASIAKVSTEPRTLYIGHGFGGGLETYLQSQLKTNPNAIILRNNPAQPGTLTLEIPGEKYFNLPVINSKLSSIMFLRDTFHQFNIQHISVQTTFGYDYNFPLWIENLAHIMNIDYSVMLHDYLTVCPRLRLVQNITYCGEPSVHECNNCVMAFGSAFGQVDVKEYRAMYHRFLKKASRVTAPSWDLEDRMKSYFDDIHIDVVPHESELTIKSFQGSLPYKEGDTLRIAVIGSISPDKGSLVIRDCAKYCENNRLPIQFLVFGNLIDNQAGIKLIEQTDYLRIFNSYKEEDLRSMLELNKCHMSFFASLWPETYSYTLSHAFRAGLFPVCYDIGAIAERIKEKAFGKILPFELSQSPEETIKALIKIARENLNDA